MNRTIIVVIVLSVLGLAGTALFLNSQKKVVDNKEQTQTNQTQTTEDKTNTKSADINAVAIESFSYLPANLTVKKGTTVTWTQMDSVEHNVVSDNDSPQKGLNGPLLSKGETNSFTFNEPGEYKYHCQRHPNMAGTVTVTE